MNQTNESSPRVEFQVHFETGSRGRKSLKKGARPKRLQPPGEDIPRLTRLLALAHRWNSMLEGGMISNRAEIAQLMAISHARVTQIMDLLNLAPDIQEDILVDRCARRQNLTERTIRTIVQTLIWADQRRHWRQLSKRKLKREFAAPSEPWL